MLECTSWKSKRARWPPPPPPPSYCNDNVKAIHTMHVMHVTRLHTGARVWTPMATTKSRTVLPFCEWRVLGAHCCDVSNINKVFGSASCIQCIIRCIQNRGFPWIDLPLLYLFYFWICFAKSFGIVRFVIRRPADTPPDLNAALMVKMIDVKSHK